MNLEDAVCAIAALGLTERQARFLVLVARHSGVCVVRQYSALVGIVFGPEDAEGLREARTASLVGRANRKDSGATQATS